MLLLDFRSLCFILRCFGLQNGIANDNATHFCQTYPGKPKQKSQVQRLIIKHAKYQNVQTLIGGLSLRLSQERTLFTN